MQISVKSRVVVSEKSSYDCIYDFDDFIVYEIRCHRYPCAPAAATAPSFQILTFRISNFLRDSLGWRDGQSVLCAVQAPELARDRLRSHLPPQPFTAPPLFLQL